MFKIKLLSCLAVIGMALLVCVSLAFAEFTSQGTTKGEVRYTGLTLETSGGLVECFTHETVKSLSQWLVEKESKQTTKGPDLAVQVKKWGECAAEGQSLKRGSAKVTGSECELLVEEPGAETTAKASVGSTCSFSITAKEETCEVKIEPTPNKERKGVVLAASGEQNVNLISNTKLENVTTTTSSACASKGFKSTKEGRLIGASEEVTVKGGQAIGVVDLRRVGILPVVLNEERSVAVDYNGLVEPFTLPANALITKEATNGGVPATEVFFKVEANTVAQCQAFTFTLENRVCAMKAKAIKIPPVNQPAIFLTFTVTAGGALSEVQLRTG